jgi:hypothetical protein
MRWRATGGSGWSTRSMTPRRWSARLNWARLQRCCSCWTATTGTAALAEPLGVPLLSVPDAVPDSPFSVVRVIRNRLWREAALWWPERRALVVAEVLGTAPAFALGAAVGVHPMVRMTPPGVLRGIDPEVLLVGHGGPVSGAAVADDVDRAIAHSRRDAPKLVLKLPSLIKDARG